MDASKDIWLLMHLATFVQQTWKAFYLGWETEKHFSYGERMNSLSPVVGKRKVFHLKWEIFHSPEVQN